MLKELFKNNRGSLFFVYLLFFIESLLSLIYPMILGNSIDEFISGNYYYIINLVLVLGGFVYFSYLRRIYDTRVFSTIYRKMILRYIGSEIDKNEKTSVINARTNMLNTVVSFFEVDLPYIFYSLFSIIGSVFIIMFYYNVLIGLFILVFLIPIYYISEYFRKLLSVKYNESNNINEKDVEVIDSKDKLNIKHHYILKNLLSIQISNIDARNNLFNYSVNYLVIVIVLILFIIFDDPTIGIIMGLYNYVLNYISGVGLIPNLILRYEYLKDVLNRIEYKNNI
jgi:ABC-type multidrug transport system fused ATPase/permease subunit